PSMLETITPPAASLTTSLAENTPATIHEKALRTRGAQSRWAATPLANRIAIIANFRQSLVDRHDELCATLTQEVGKPLRQSSNEIKGVLARIDFFLEHTARTLQAETVCDDASQKLREEITHEPLGV